MKLDRVFKSIKTALDGAPRNAYVAQLHVQVIKHFDALHEVSGKEFCEALGIGVSFGTEFLKMRKIVQRLQEAGLDVDRL